MMTDEEQPSVRKIPKSYKLSPECVGLLSELAAKLGLSYTAVLELAVRWAAEKEGLR